MRSYLLAPFGPADLKNKIFESPYGRLREALARHQIDLQTYDQGDLEQADKVLFFNHQPGVYAACRRHGLTVDQLVLFLFEPSVVQPHQYSKRIRAAYDTVFTFLDSLVDNQKFFKMFYPQGQTLMTSLPTWPERKFLTLVNANKYSYVVNELYSRRRQAIQHFEHHADFDLYGYDWNRNGALSLSNVFRAFRSGRWAKFGIDVLTGFHHSPRYLGTVENKRATLAQYKFSLAFENEEKTQGYITEKIFDCFFTGTVPVYLGADNITDYIPADCFIDLRKFSSFAKLEAYLRQMSQTEWAGYHQHGQVFIRSDAFARWEPKHVFTSMAEHL